MTQWHSIPPAQLLKLLDSNKTRGLSAHSAAKQLSKYGPNQLDRIKPVPLPLRVLNQLKDPMILVLLAAAALSLFVGEGDALDAAIILIIVAVNAVISILQEDNARRAMDALEKLSAPKAKVLRDGQLLCVDTAKLVPGDMIQLEAGDLVPADARILECAGVTADESAMTGESVPVSKETVDALPPDTPLADRRNMLLSATVLTGGHCTAIVTATGMDTAVGRVALLLHQTGDLRTPLQCKMAEVSKTLSFLCVAVCAVLFAIGLLRGKVLLDMFLTAVSLAVAAIPEGLPAIVTIVLAMGVKDMAGKNAIIKRLPAVETLGCAGVICSDKTGTLTRNKMAVTELWPVGPAQRETLLAGALCNDCTVSREGKITGDPTEAALVDAARAEGLDKSRLDRDYPRRGEVPFDSSRKLMSVICSLPEGGYRVFVKGAPDVLLTRCSAFRALPLNEGQRQRISAAADDMAGRALRVLGVAVRDLKTLPLRLDTTLEHELTFVGLLGMIDPPRPEAARAVAACRAAGIRPVMITGDHKLTAAAIAKQLDICRPGDIAVTGADLDFMPQSMLESDVARIAVFARVTPEHKLRIVQAWQKKGYVVAMTGDGVNDAPALKAADIGCAMGRSGTDVARSAADMILTDDNFATIVAAVRQGRGVYTNIKKAIHYLLSCNLGEILVIAVATILDLPQMPLLPVQLLWLNLVTDSLPALALGMEPVANDVMTQPPRSPRESLFTVGFSFRLLRQGCMVGLLTLCAYLLGPLLSGNMATANTMAFATLTFSQLFHAYNVRSESVSLFSLGVFSNHPLNRAFLVGGAMQVVVLILPALQKVFSVVPLSAMQWGAVVLLATAPIFFCEASKALRRRIRRVTRPMRTARQWQSVSPKT